MDVLCNRTLEGQLTHPSVNDLSEDGTGRSNKLDYLGNTHIRLGLSHLGVFIGGRRLDETKTLDK
jgi:hypothetical protein